MNKAVKKLGCLLLSLLTFGSAFAGCKDNGDSSGEKGAKVYDTETRPVVFATDALDGNFNPFFATSATDSKIAAMTQIGMLTTDKLGNPVCGDDQPTVVLDYKETMRDANGDVTTNAEDASKANGGTTEYEFIIKNGIKFSDGKELTIKDVLFNLYVYLDPAYMGSATIYSTDIVGLKAYRTQDPEVDESKGESEFQTQFYAEADMRIYAMLEYLAPEDARPAPSAQVTADIEKAKELFREEITSDWTMAESGVDSYKEEYTFTEAWQVYYFREGIISVMEDAQGKDMKDEDGKYMTSLDDPSTDYTAEIEAVKNNSALIAEIMASEGCTEEEAKNYAVRDFAIETVFDSYASDETLLIKFAEVVQWWATGMNLREEFAAEARSKYYDSMKGENGLLVPNISGITTSTTTVDYDGNELGSAHSVLKIVINGVDPKAIWNFAFSVSPAHYYGSAKGDGSDVEIDIAANKFGVNFANKEFFDNVLQAPAKNGLPMGAGVYKASNAPQTNGVNKDTFYKNNWVYFERNTYFDSVGGDTITNAKIKYLRYKVVSTDKIIPALQAGDIDFGEPQATLENITDVGNSGATLNYKNYLANGYGYVGINPKYVPDIEVRQAIMKAMNVNLIIETYYTDKLASVVYRSMSKTSWAYPKTAEEYYSYAVDTSEITSLVEDADWRKGADGIYAKNGKKLSFTFTIAGSSTDHPAYEMFMDAKTVLNSCGFDITVMTDNNALKSLATGGLAVWAAAWSSTVDPDLYQVYHKDSNATSIKNWGYETIFADTTGQFTDEQTIINALSTKIEEARQTISKPERTALYAEALDMIMDLAVELPTYQRNDLVVYNKVVIDASTLNDDPSANAGVYDRLWEVDYN